MKRCEPGQPEQERRRRRPALLICLITALIVGSAMPATAATTPTPPQPLPSDVDIVDEYEGQRLCDPAPKDGTLRLRDTLWRTYGRSIWAGISRDCNVSWDPGISEHKDGRAIDWGVNVRNPSTKAMGDEFFAWATANNGEMARRLGIMYIIWDSRMWRLYDMGRGFPEYRNCVTQLTTPSYDTSCHRDHMHISMTWHGAGASTSWYSGRPILLGTCRAGDPVRVEPGQPGAPAVIFDPTQAKGTTKPCYLNRSIQTVRLGGTSGADFTQRIRVTQLSVNAPTELRVTNSAGRLLTIPRGTPLPAEFTVPVGADGLLYFSVPAGQASLRVEGLGRTTRAQYAAFVTQGYRDVLGRDPDPGGLEGWTSAVLNGTVPRSALIDALVYSTEGAQGIATTFYRDILGRAPDPAGLVNWGQLISSRAVNVKNTRMLFWTSQERIQQSGTAEQWVADFYRVELARAAAPQEQTAWADVVRAQGRDAVAKGIFNSQEWLQRQVTAQYQQMLKRNPDPGGLAGWSTVLSRTDLPVLQAALGGSEEYFQRAMKK